jgi:transcriptional regulator with XRE-family HTH domain
MFIGEAFTDNFRKNFKALRQKNYLSQARLADILGVKTSTISNYETGLCLPSTERLLYISKFFSVSLDFLIGRQPIDGIKVPFEIPYLQEINDLPSDGEYAIFHIEDNRLLLFGVKSGAMAIVKKNGAVSSGNLVVGVSRDGELVAGILSVRNGKKFVMPMSVSDEPTVLVKEIYGKILYTFDKFK